MAQPIETLIDEADEAIRFLDSLLAVEMPSSVSDAIERKHEFAFDGGAAGLSFVLYPNEEREADSRRVVPIRWVLLALELMEDAMIREQREGKTIVDPFLSLPRTLVGVWKVLRALSGLPLIEGAPSGQYFRFRPEVSAFFYRLMFQVLTIASVAALVKLALGVHETHGFYVEQLRKKALPQSSGQRYSRRKRARL